MFFAATRIVRDIKAILYYPAWILSRQKPPDNHRYKINRIKRIGREFGCQTLLETGTFYGQTVYATRNSFERVLSIEVYEPLYRYNLRQFADVDNVLLFLGDSALLLPKMIRHAEGRILYWLDGHYSGQGTGKGNDECPIFEELIQIKKLNRQTDCILIDDKRLFGIDPAYPALSEIEAALRAINPHYTIFYESDCILALPGKIQQIDSI